MLLKEPTLDNSFTVEPKLKLILETFYPSTLFLKVPLSATLNKDLETEEFSLKLPEPTVLLSDTLMMEPEPESDYLLEPEKLSPEIVDALLEFALEEEEPINLS